jgi:hypothetical protein
MLVVLTSKELFDLFFIRPPRLKLSRDCRLCSQTCELGVEKVTSKVYRIVYFTYVGSEFLWTDFNQV